MVASLKCVLDGTDFALVGENNKLLGIIFREPGEIYEMEEMRHGENKLGKLLEAAPHMLAILMDVYPKIADDSMRAKIGALIVKARGEA